MTLEIFFYIDFKKSFKINKYINKKKKFTYDLRECEKKKLPDNIFYKN